MIRLRLKVNGNQISRYQRVEFSLCRGNPTFIIFKTCDGNIFINSSSYLVFPDIVIFESLSVFPSSDLSE